MLYILLEEVSFFQNSSSRPADIRSYVSICTTATYFASQTLQWISVISQLPSLYLMLFNVKSTRTRPKTEDAVDMCTNITIFQRKGRQICILINFDRSKHVRPGRVVVAGWVSGTQNLSALQGVRQILQNRSELFSGIDYVNMFTICFIILGLLWTYLDIPCHCSRSGS